MLYSHPKALSWQSLLDTATATTGKGFIMSLVNLSPHDLYPHPRESSIYGNNQDIAELAAKIKESGWIAPLVVSLRTGRYVIISGHRRWFAALELQLPFVPVEVQEFATEEEELEALLLHNLYREKTTEQKGREALVWQEIEQERAKGRQGARNDLRNIPPNLGGCSQGEALEKMAGRVGMGKTSLDKTLKVIKETDALRNEGDAEQAEKWLGVLNKQSVDAAHKLLDVLPEQRERVLALVDEGQKVNAALRKVSHEQKRVPPPFPSNKYRVVYADPPWAYGNSGVIGESDNYGRAERHYPTMSIDELCALGENIQGMLEDNAVLFLWVTSPLLEECFDVIRAWGFKYKTSFVWDKVAHNFGHYNSVRHEFLLICTRGSCLPDNGTLLDSVVSIEKSRKHSEKPEEFRELINSLYLHGNRIELFSRKQVEGWDAWGNE